METIHGFDYEIFVTVKNHIKGYVDDLVYLIVMDRDAGNGYATSFVDIAEKVGVEVTSEIFKEMLTAEELANCTQAWDVKRKTA